MSLQYNFLFIHGTIGKKKVNQLPVRFGCQCFIGLAKRIFTLDRNVAVLSLNLTSGWFLIRGWGLKALSTLKAKILKCRIVGLSEIKYRCPSYSNYPDKVLFSRRAWKLILPNPILEKRIFCKVLLRSNSACYWTLTTATDHSSPSSVEQDHSHVSPRDGILQSVWHPAKIPWRDREFWWHQWRIQNR